MTEFPTISALPPAPSRSDPANFNSEAEAFVAALATLRTELNSYRSSLIAFAAEANLPLDWDVDTWTPTLSFATPGDSTWSYSQQNGWYRQLDTIAHVGFSVIATPTFTTASGILRIGAFPLTLDTTKRIAIPVEQARTITYPSGYTQIVARWDSASAFRLALLGSGQVNTDVDAADCSSGTALFILGSGVAFINNS